MYRNYHKQVVRILLFSLALMTSFSVLVANDDITTLLSVNDPDSLKGQFIQECECAMLSNDWLPVDDELASDGMGITYIGEEANPGSPESAVIYEIEIEEAGEYDIWFRLKTDGGEAGGFWVQINDGPVFLQEDLFTGDEFDWFPVNSADPYGTPVSMYFNSGTAVLKAGLLNNSMATVLDKFKVQPTQTLKPGGLGGVSIKPCNPTISPCHWPVIYVDVNATGNNTGISWQDAFTNLQSAVSVINSCPSFSGQVWVADGTYRPASRHTSATFNNSWVNNYSTTNQLYLSYLLNKPAKFYGGFQGNETSIAQRQLGSYPTILAGDISTSHSLIPDVDYIFGFELNTSLSSTSMIVDGFTFTGQNSGGMLTDYHQYEAKSCEFKNLGKYGILNYESFMFTTNHLSTSKVENCKFTETLGVQTNEIEIVVKGSIFDKGKYALQLRNLSDFLVENCEFTNGGILNSTVGGGYNGHGGPVWTFESTGEFKNCRFEDNKGDVGGAVYIIYDNTQSGNITFDRCIFKDNTAKDLGGAIAKESCPITVDIKNCLFEGNTADKGGAFYSEYSPSFNILNSTFVHNSATSAQGGEILHIYRTSNKFEFKNVITWGNGEDSLITKKQINTVDVQINYSILDGSQSQLPTGTNIGTKVSFGIDPLFINPGTNWKLQVNSPALDQGDNTPWNGYINPLDLAGQQRIQNTTIDMGAYEGGGPVEDSLISNPGLETSTQIFPNPSNGFFTLEFPEVPIDPVIIEMYDIHGLIWVGDFEPAPQIPMDFSYLEPGLYTLKVIKGELMETHGVQIQ